MEYALRRSKVYQIVVSLLMALMVVFSVVPVYADGDEQIAKQVELAASAKVKWNKEGNALEQSNGGFPTGSRSVTVTNSITKQTATINIDDVTYQKLAREGEKLLVKDKVNSAMGGINVQADTDRAQELLGGVHPIIELFCGVIVYAIVLGLPVFTSLDILYITYPVFRNTIQESASKGGMMAKTRKDGSTGIRWVSDEAQFAVENANLGEGRTALGIYSKKRFMVYIICTVMLFVFLTGNIQIFTNLAVQIVSGIISVIQGIS